MLGSLEYRDIQSSCKQVQRSLKRTAGLIFTLEERLATHGAQLQGQIPELLHRSNRPVEAIRNFRIKV